MLNDKAALVICNGAVLRRVLELVGDRDGDVRSFVCGDDNTIAYVANFRVKGSVFDDGKALTVWIGRHRNGGS